MFDLIVRKHAFRPRAEALAPEECAPAEERIVGCRWSLATYRAEADSSSPAAVIATSGRPRSKVAIEVPVRSMRSSAPEVVTNQTASEVHRSRAGPSEA